MSRRICFVTGSRADYGHLSSVMAAVRDHADLSLQVVVTGQHLDARYGNTWNAIADDGFNIDDKVDLALGADTPLDTAHAVGRGVSALADSFSRLSPDIVVVLGDRFEILAAAQAALLLNIPLAHIHGGEATEAAVDDAIRHAITKMARLHFCAAEPYAARVRQMGEDPAHVFTVGAPGLDHLSTLKFLARDELARDLGIEIGERLFVVTYHPVTLKLDQGAAAVGELMTALKEFKDVAMVFTGVNSDPGNRVISDAVTAFVAEDLDRRVMVNSLGQRRYLSAVREADVVIGNSSSGLIEAPALGVPTVNIGDRQKGRLHGASVLTCSDEAAAIGAAITRALDPAFTSAAAASEPPYGRGGAAPRIATVLASADLGRLSTKPFRDIIES
jgi:UDP-hydrolysing UDP-N-acetyl-D-glucosamine 2-epimerase